MPLEEAGTEPTCARRDEVGLGGVGVRVPPRDIGNLAGLACELRDIFEVVGTEAKGEAEDEKEAKVYVLEDEYKKNFFFPENIK